MQFETIQRPRREQAMENPLGEEPGGAAAIAAAFAETARQAAEACRTQDVDKELERRRNSPGQ